MDMMISSGRDFCAFVFTMVNSPWTDELDQC